MSLGQKAGNNERVQPPRNQQSHQLPIQIPSFRHLQSKTAPTPVSLQIKSHFFNFFLRILQSQINQNLKIEIDFKVQKIPCPRFDDSGVTLMQSLQKQGISSQLVGLIQRQHNE